MAIKIKILSLSGWEREVKSHQNALTVASDAQTG
jgi:hypothetical protein